MGDHRGRQTIQDKTSMVERWHMPFGKVFNIPVREGNACKA